MHSKDRQKFQKELNSGLVSLVLLAVIAASDEDLYGYEIAKRLQRAHLGEPLFKEGSLYPVLRALSATGALGSRIVPSYSGPPRRYYRITAQGRQQLEQRSLAWRETRNFVEAALEPLATI
ncbi:MAG: PadR family transcriptional regulator [Gammaproteobacteria bacterium]|nr:PadR family transcriptional regulator [Gammaproteobacteria bacterium]